VGRLFNLYNKQIEKYQRETQSRASYSFLLAVLSMIAGLGILVWGGWTIVHDPNLVASGSVIAAIGGAMSAYITKTFLDVHKLSLRQLNHYFKQPVLNSHILTAQRLTDLLEDKDAKKKALLIRSRTL
jgi:ABC-type multidrug transport system fused ATPase/permease subunit